MARVDFNTLQSERPFGLMGLGVELLMTNRNYRVITTKQELGSRERHREIWFLFFFSYYLNYDHILSVVIFKFYSLVY